MIKYAYGVKSDDQLVGAPGWLKMEHFDIQAKMSDADVAALYKLGFEDRSNVPRLLMRSLLEDRFQLKAKVETRDLPVYALVVDKGGIKMKEVTPEPDPLTPPGVVPDARSRSFKPTGPTSSPRVTCKCPISQSPSRIFTRSEIGQWSMRRD